MKKKIKTCGWCKYFKPHKTYRKTRITNKDWVGDGKCEYPEVKFYAAIGDTCGRYKKK